MDDELYKANILDHYRHPHHWGGFPDFSHKKRSTNPSCGDELTVYMKWGSDGRIAQVGFEGSGCAISQAATSMLMDEVIGKTQEDIQALTPKHVDALLGIHIGESREKCSTLGLQILRSMVEPTNT